MKIKKTQIREKAENIPPYSRLHSQPRPPPRHAPSVGCGDGRAVHGLAGVGRRHRRRLLLQRRDPEGDARRLLPGLHLARAAARPVLVPVQGDRVRVHRRDREADI